jgi:hypothetical protein
MSDTPRTDAAEYESQDEPVTKLGAVDANFARTIERELNAGIDRIKRLEAAGDVVEKKLGCGCGCYGLCKNCQRASENWLKAKEAKP